MLEGQLNTIESLLEMRCTTFYEALVADTPEGTTEWRGVMQTLIDGTDIPASARTMVRKQLTALGCIKVLQTGNSRQQTIIKLVKPPSEVEWTRPSDDELTSGALTRQTKYDRLAAQVADVKRQIGGLDIPSVLSAVTVEIATIKTRLAELEKVVTDGKSQ